MIKRLLIIFAGVVSGLFGIGTILISFDVVMNTRHIADGVKVIFAVAGICGGAIIILSIVLVGAGILLADDKLDIIARCF